MYSRAGESLCSACAAPPGQYCSGGPSGTTQFTACPSGYTCNGGTNIPYRYTCTTGTVEGSQCKIGVAPFNCPEASAYIKRSHAMLVANGNNTMGVLPDSEGNVCFYQIMGNQQCTATIPSSYRYQPATTENLYVMQNVLFT